MCVCVRLPKDILKITLKSDQMRRDINFAVHNIYGYRTVVTEPFMVVEHFVKEETERLKQPVLKCIDAVIKELRSAVRLCTQHVSVFFIILPNFIL